jgi:hypothetical protein
MTTSELRLAIYGDPHREWPQIQVWRSAAKFAVEDGRRRSPGAPILWRLK